MVKNFKTQLKENPYLAEALRLEGYTKYKSAKARREEMREYMRARRAAEVKPYAAEFAAYKAAIREKEKVILEAKEKVDRLRRIYENARYGKSD